MDHPRLFIPSSPSASYSPASVFLRSLIDFGVTSISSSSAMNSSALFERHFADRHEAHRFVGRRRSHVREFLFS